LAPLLEDYNRK